MSYPPYPVDTTTQGLPPVEPLPQPDGYGYPIASVPPQQPTLSNVEDGPPPYFGGVVQSSVQPVIQPVVQPVVPQQTYPTTGPVLSQQQTHVVYGSSGVYYNKNNKMFIIIFVIFFVFSFVIFIIVFIIIISVFLSQS